jgi:FKBP-type peptidyl-prolyl cis-trans isomerase SlyD
MAIVKKGDIVKMEYTGKMAATGQVFDTTDEAIAKKHGLYESGTIYGPRFAVFGSGAIIPGMEEAILQSKLGQSEDFAIEPKKAFGERDTDLVRMIAEKEFFKNQVRPSPGMMVSLDGALARVKSVTSGRVVIDFNHPLAGEQVVYSIKVHEIVTEDAARAEALLSSIGVKGTVTATGGKLTVSLEKGTPAEKADIAKRAIADVVPKAEVKSG